MHCLVVFCWRHTGRRVVVLMLVMVVCLSLILMQLQVLQNFPAFGAVGSWGRDQGSSVSLGSPTPSRRNSKVKNDHHNDLGNNMVIPLKWRPQVRWPLMVFSSVGRLGNCLNTYAFALAFRDAFPATVAVTRQVVKKISMVLAGENLTLPVVGIKFVQEADEEGVVEVVEPDYIKDDMVSHLMPTFQRAVKEYQEGGGHKVFMLPGYPNRMWMIAKHLNAIRDSFTILPELQQEARRFLEKARKVKGRDVTFVSFHIRRSDYVSFIKNFNNCSLPGPEFYEAAMNYYRASFTDLLFVVTSDDLSHARHHLQHHPDVLFSDLGTPEKDMALLAACSHSIMTVGSFGFWSSFLAGGRVVYPLLDDCSKTPFMHPDNLGSLGFENWHPLDIQSRSSEV